MEKAAKAQWYARNEGMVYGKLLIACPLNWRSEERMGQRSRAGRRRLAASSPCTRSSTGITHITYDPEGRKKRVPVSEWLGMMGKTRHMLRPENAGLLHEFEEEVERRWRRLKARDEHPLL